MKNQFARLFDLEEGQLLLTVENEESAIPDGESSGGFLLFASTMGDDITIKSGGLFMDRDKAVSRMAAISEDQAKDLQATLRDCMTSPETYFDNCKKLTDMLADETEQSSEPTA